MKNELLPLHLNLDDFFSNSVFQNIQTETLLWNLVLYQVSKNPNSWTEFKLADFYLYCGKNDLYYSGNIIRALVEGGSPDFKHSSANFESGYLIEIEKGIYMVSKKLQDALYKYASKS